MLHGDAVPGHVDGLDGAKWSEGRPHGIVTKLKVDAAHIDSEGTAKCSVVEPLTLPTTQSILLQSKCIKLLEGNRGFALFTFSAKKHGDGGHNIIGGQIVLSLLRFAFQYGRCHHGVAMVP